MFRFSASRTIYGRLPKAKRGTKKRKVISCLNQSTINIMNEGKSIHSSEQNEQPPKISLIMRANRTYTPELAAFIQASLGEAGREVSLVQIFPAGTPEEEIQRWSEEHSPDLQGTNILADETFRRATQQEIYSLDSQMLSAVLDVLTQGSSKEKTPQPIPDQSLTREERREKFLDEETAKFEHSADILLEIMLRNPEHRPEKVCIVQNGLQAHQTLPGSLRAKIDGENDDEVNAACAEQWKALLEKHGIPEEAIKILNLKYEMIGGRLLIDRDDKGYKDLFMSDILSEKPGWLLIDRHYSSLLNPTDFEKLAMMELPLKDLVRDAMRLGLIEITEEEIKDAVKKSVRSAFQK